MSSQPPTSRRPPRPFKPPFCPNPECRHHLPSPDWHFIRIGHRIRLSDQRRIPRFRCATCRRVFSSATFRATYWLRYRHLLVPIARLSVSGAGLRQIARTLHIAHATVARHIARAGRHCLLYHSQFIEGLDLHEPIVADGFESFEFSQYFPCHYNLAVGSESWLIYHFNDSPLRRKGRMTAAQRLKRAQIEERLGRPDPKAIEKAMLELVTEVVRHLPSGAVLELRTDEHPAYPRALGHLADDRPRILHQQTNSQKPRTAENPLFAVNLADLLLRHCHANHRRETIAFSKRRQAGLERMAVFVVWRNVIKRHRENGAPETPAMLLGLAERMLHWRDVFGRRRFPGHVRLPMAWQGYYWRQVRTLALGDRQAVHGVKYAI